MAAPKQYGNRILVVGGIGIFSVGTYIALKLREQAQAHPLINALQIKPGNMFDDFADDYDNSCRLPEFALGINWMRWWLLRKAKGHVLEVAAGTGRNLQYYQPKQVHSLTLLDSSAAMLRNAALKARDGVAYPECPPANALVPLREQPANGIVYVVQDAQRTTSSCTSTTCHASLGSLTRVARQHAKDTAAMRAAFAAAYPQASMATTPMVAAAEAFTGGVRHTQHFPSREEAEMLRARAREFAEEFQRGKKQGGGKQGEERDGEDSHACCVQQGLYDSVVDTFGLCSVADPVAVVNEMAAACKPDGRLLLLEHGLGMDWTQDTLFRSSRAHELRYGCVLNRDLDDIMEKADVQVLSHQKWLFGLFHLIEARPQAAIQGADLGSAYRQVE